MNQTKKDNWDKAKIIAEILAILIVIGYGHIINNSITKHESDLKLVQVAIDILRTEPNDNTIILREWAIEIVDNFSGIPLSPGVKAELLKKQLPISNIILTFGDEPITFGKTPLTFGSQPLEQEKK